MRWIFISLIVANIAVFGYFQFAGAAPAANPGRGQVSPFDPSSNTGLLMLNERQAAVDAERSSSKVSTKSTDSAITYRDNGSVLCSLVGPFDKLLLAEYFVERLASLGVFSRVKEVGIPTASGYWVYLPPEASRKEALRRLGELQNKGIDSYVIPKGELANGISLGMYTNRERALAMQAQVNQQGYSASIADVPRENKQVWVFLEAAEAAKIDDNVWLELLGGEESIDKRQNFCSDLAS